MRERRHRHVVRLDDVEESRLEKGSSYGFTRRQLGAAAGSSQLGCSHMELLPGKKSWPRHWHAANEEALFILEGEGTLRLGDDEVAVSAGDYVALPVGPELAHQLMNTSTAPLRYLALSTMLPTDITVYPDSDKVMLFGGAAPGGTKSERFLDAALSSTAKVDYWHGELDKD